MKYQIMTAQIGQRIVHNVIATDVFGNQFIIPMSDSNSDYQQYLIDTDGGLAIPEGE